MLRQRVGCLFFGIAAMSSLAACQTPPSYSDLVVDSLRRNPEIRQKYYDDCMRSRRGLGMSQKEVEFDAVFFLSTPARYHHDMCMRARQALISGRITLDELLGKGDGAKLIQVYEGR
jgi:hypothetical protein